MEVVVVASTSVEKNVVHQWTAVVEVVVAKVVVQPFQLVVVEVYVKVEPFVEEEAAYS